MTIERLIEWYDNVLAKAKEMGVVKSICTFSQEQKRHPDRGPTSLTLFGDGLWSRVMIEACATSNRPNEKFTTTLTTPPPSRKSSRT